MIPKGIIDILDFARISRVFNIHPNSSTYPFLMHSLNLPVPFPHPNKLVLPKKKKSTKLKEFLLKALQVGTTMSLLLSSPGFAIHPPVLPVSVWVCVSLDSKHLIFAGVCVCEWAVGDSPSSPETRVQWHDDSFALLALTFAAWFSAVAFNFYFNFNFLSVFYLCE